MIGARVAALGEDVGNVTVLRLPLAKYPSSRNNPTFRKRATNLSNHTLDKFRQPRIHEIRDDPHAFLLPRLQRPRHISCHILLQHRLDILALLLVLGKNSLAPQ